MPRGIPNKKTVSRTKTVAKIATAVKKEKVVQETNVLDTVAPVAQTASVLEQAMTLLITQQTRTNESLDKQGSLLERIADSLSNQTKQEYDPTLVDKLALEKPLRAKQKWRISFAKHKDEDGNYDRATDPQYFETKDLAVEFAEKYYKGFQTNFLPVNFIS